MMQNYIILLGMVELFLFFALIYLIIRANVFINALQQEIKELHLALPVLVRDIRNDLKEFNAELTAKFNSGNLSPQKIGFIVGKIFTEIILLRFKAAHFSKKFVIISFVLKAMNINKLLKPSFSKK